MGGKQSSLAPAWKELGRLLDLDPPTKLDEQVYLGIKQTKIGIPSKIVEEKAKLEWERRALIPGLMDASYSYSFEPINHNSTRFRQNHQFAGILIPIFRGTLKGTHVGFRLMQTAVKERAEKPG